MSLSGHLAAAQFVDYHLGGEVIHGWDCNLKIFIIDLKQGTLVSLAFHFPASTCKFNNSPMQRQSLTDDFSAYVNSALAMLNARRHIKESGQGEAWTLGTGEDIPMQVSLHKESSATGSMKEWSSVDNGSVKLENMDVRGDGTSFMHSMTMLIARILCSILIKRYCTNSVVPGDSNYHQRRPLGPLLPMELWDMIIDLLRYDPSTLHSCETVCKSGSYRIKKHLPRSSVLTFRNCHDVSRMRRNDSRSWTPPEIIVTGEDRRRSLSHLTAVLAMYAWNLELNALTITHGNWRTALWCEIPPPDFSVPDLDTCSLRVLADCVLAATSSPVLRLRLRRTGLVPPEKPALGLTHLLKATGLALQDLSLEIYGSIGISPSDANANANASDRHAIPRLRTAFVALDLILSHRRRHNLRRVYVGVVTCRATEEDQVITQSDLVLWLVQEENPGPDVEQLARSRCTRLNAITSPPVSWPEYTGERATAYAERQIARAGASSGWSKGKADERTPWAIIWREGWYRRERGTRMRVEREVETSLERSSRGKGSMASLRPAEPLVAQNDGVIEIDQGRPEVVKGSFSAPSASEGPI
ncbi:hypothetical protein POSPLADRAFT_1032351 [Postia placenta MAD-698-R-SB12]|uniref:Uncharacterized protein n=1 Tax=Postia placenta MAD-698-R-SB12 TaxID=670580 RepID=A0A1X6N5P6_9APHY|nr:hypothetical protein POSPLADRAFT_1032351 [Postia placenta MAD-698-R-SB12]OSX63806.1 hypothetical protein POSPLADRAFT_1032351 [Postia placenta MAD-698-R-SB12]